MDFHNSLSEDDFTELQYKCRKVWEEWLSPEGFFANFYRHFEFKNEITELDKGSSGRHVTASNKIYNIESDKPFCLFINTYYTGFLKSFYNKNTQVLSKSYQEQKCLLEERFFGDSDFYSEGIKKNGWETDDLVVNGQKKMVLKDLQLRD
jgi:hypothetical protein